MARGFGSAPGADSDIALASDPDTSRDQLLELAHSRNPMVRIAVVGREDCSVGTLALLAQDRDADVRAAVATHARCPAASLSRLAQDRDEGVVIAVALSSATGEGLLTELAASRHSEAARIARDRLDGLNPTVEEPSLSEQQEVSSQDYVGGARMHGAKFSEEAAEECSATTDTGDDPEYTGGVRMRGIKRDDGEGK